MLHAAVKLKKLTVDYAPHTLAQGVWSSVRYWEVIFVLKDTGLTSRSVRCPEQRGSRFSEVNAILNAC